MQTSFKSIVNSWTCGPSVSRRIVFNFGKRHAHKQGQWSDKPRFGNRTYTRAVRRFQEVLHDWVSMPIFVVNSSLLQRKLLMKGKHFCRNRLAAPAQGFYDGAARASEEPHFTINSMSCKKMKNSWEEEKLPRTAFYFSREEKTFASNKRQSVEMWSFKTVAYDISDYIQTNGCTEAFRDSDQTKLQLFDVVQQSDLSKQ